MAKYIIGDFFSAFRIDRLKQNKASFTCICLTAYIIWMSIFVNRGWSDREIAWRNVIVENALFLPMIFSFCSVMAHPVQLTKMMYLCPMSPGERRRYIYGSYYFRIGMHMLVFAAGLCVIVANAYCDVISMIQILLNDAIAAVMLNHRQQTGDRGRAMVIGEILFVTAALSNAMQFCIVCDMTPGNWIQWVLFFLFCLVQLPLGIWYVKYIRRVLRRAVYYENSLEN